jgi:F-type H+-transporting ATPase subunit gamma
MASLRDIRKRIVSVKSTQKITKAMKMVAASKLRRAQDAILKARPYAQLLEAALAEVAARADGGESPAHPLLAQREKVKKTELVLLTSDRGLAGAFNSNINRKAVRYLLDHRDEGAFQISTMGRKARDYFRRQHTPIRKDYPGIYDGLRFERAQEIAEELAKLYLGGEVDRILLVYNRFKSAIAQDVVVVPFLPIETAPKAADPGKASAVDFVYEPSRAALLDVLLPKHVSMQLWRALLESVASEHGARMTAMENASRNAGDMIDSLTLKYNRARQAAITKELMEIVSGAEALK